ncbi:MAG: ParB/RepB/Spo0J family partition protein [Herpetosiphonaceae bacterium]|nr:ParB/RepB/Spo0J family partition protein [Herpetosiphonaceae bacterium]
MPRPKNFMERGPRPKAALEDDIAALYEREHPAERRETRNVPIAYIRPNPFQARRSFEGLADLAQAIRLHGFISWLRVRPDPAEPGFYQLVYGERRLRAAKEAGLTEVPCEIVEHTDVQMIEIGLAENIQRQDLDPLEEARMFRTLIEQRGYSQRSLAERIGKDKGYVENRLVLLRIPEDVQEMVTQRPESMSAARAIAKLATAEERRPLIDAVLAGKLTKQDIYEMVSETLAPVTRELSTSEPTNGTAVPVPPAHAPREPTAPSFDHMLPRDISMLQTIFARWTSALPMTTSQRRNVLGFMEDEFLQDIESLLHALRAAEQSKDSR